MASIQTLDTLSKLRREMKLMSDNNKEKVNLKILIFIVALVGIIIIVVASGMIGGGEGGSAGHGHPH